MEGCTQEEEVEVLEEEEPTPGESSALRFGGDGFPQFTPEEGCKYPRDCSPPFLLERPQGPRTGDFTSARITISGRLLTACSKKGPAQFT